MEPLLGGCLAKPPDAVKELFAVPGITRSPADLALQWIWSQPEVSLVLSGMSAMRQVEENLASAEASAEGTLTAQEIELVARVRGWFEERTAVNCTNCGYCLPCPAGVNIPGLFELLNYGVRYDSMPSSCFRYQRFFPEDERASACTGCAECEEKCPQDIGISELMPRVHATLAEGKPF
jgi:predicted aldo/keto reductase-like oxidoreductase